MYIYIYIYIYDQYQEMKHLQDAEELGSKLYIFLSVFLLQTYNTRIHKRTCICIHIYIYIHIIPLSSYIGGSDPWNSSRSWLFSRGPGPPPVHFLKHFEWIKSRGQSVPFVQRVLFANARLGRGAISFEHFGTSKMTKGQAPQNIFAMLWIWNTYMLDM